MNDDLHNIDDLFKRALEEHTEIPSPVVWDNIDKKLDKKEVVNISKKYYKLKWAAAALLLFSFGMAMYTLHIRSKNKELIKQHNIGKNLENQKISTKNNDRNFTRGSKNNNAGIEKVKVSDALKNQENNNTSTVSVKKIIPRGNKNRGDKVSRRNIQAGENALAKLLPEEKTNENIPNLNKKGILLKKDPPDKTQESSANINPGRNKGKNTMELMVPGTGQGITLDKQNDRLNSNDKLNSNIVSPGERYVHKIQAPELNYVLQLQATKGVSEIPELLTNNTPPLTNNNIIIKHKTVSPLKPHNFKKGINPLLSAVIFFSPDLVSTDVKNDHPLFREEDSHEIEKDEKIKSSSTMGILIDLNTGKNWILESGITFSTRFTDIEPKTIYARPDNNGNINYRFNCSAGYSFVTLKSAGMPPVYGDSINALTSKNILQYAGIPLIIKYVFGNGRFNITTGAGITANFLTSGKIKTTIPTMAGNESVTSNDIRGLKSMYFNGSASVGAQYKLNKTFELTFVPTARFALSSINKNAPVKTYLNSIGLAGGIILKL